MRQTRKHMYYYTYEIHILNPDSELNDTYYYGKRETDKPPDLDKYYGSGKLVLRYIGKYGLQGIHKKVLNVFNTREKLNEAERALVSTQKSTLGDKCLNLHEGGSGGHWVEYCTPREYAERIQRVVEGVYRKTTPESRKLNAINAARGMKNLSPEKRKKLSETHKKRHQNMSQDKKQEIYSKVSSSLHRWYSDPNNEELQREKNRKNRATNIESSKKWRAEFYSIFNCTPEKFRSYGKMKEAIELYKKVKDSPNLYKTEIDNMLIILKEDKQE